MFRLPALGYERSQRGFFDGIVEDMSQRPQGRLERSRVIRDDRAAHCDTEREKKKKIVIFPFATSHG